VSRSEPVTSLSQRIAVAAILAVAAALVAGLRHWPDSASRAAPAAAAPGAVVSAVSRGGIYSLVQLPPDGLGAIYQLVTSARRSIDLEIYEFADPVMADALVAAHIRGVEVRVLLSRAYHSKAVNQVAFGYLQDHGVAVRWAPAATIFHVKVMVVDGQRALISSGNLTPADYEMTSDAAVIDRNPRQVAAISATLAADWTHPHSLAAARAAPGLLWSPRAALGLIANIASARVSVFFTSEELADADVYNALAADARRGVACYVVMTGSRSWDRGFRALAGAGCHVHVAADRPGQLYFHIKRVIVDAGHASESLLLGSQNASSTSLNANRELSLLLTHSDAPTLIAAAAATFRVDYADTSGWSG
jgi:cardiolipin synthase A/B